MFVTLSKVCFPMYFEITKASIFNDIFYLTIKNYYLASLTLREERRLRVFENRVLRRVFGPKRDEVTREWRKLHNEELSDLYSLPLVFCTPYPILCGW
jgi:hypothetical protein